MVMLENRSFDSYFGTHKGMRGYGDRFPVPSANAPSIFYQSYGASTLIPYHLDGNAGNAQRAGGTPHTWNDAQAAWDHGRMAAWPNAKTPLSMGYYDTAEVPFQRALADAFTACDAYHCGMHTGTIPNRLFYWTGTNGPSGLDPDTNAPVGSPRWSMSSTAATTSEPPPPAGHGPPTPIARNARASAGRSIKA